MGDISKKVGAHTGPKKDVFLTNTIRIWNTEMICTMKNLIYFLSPEIHSIPARYPAASLATYI
jgi:hypothetical protein